MNKNLKQGLVLFFISSIFTGMLFQFVEITWYLCKISNTPWWLQSYKHINKISLLMVVVAYAISLVFLISGIQEERNKKAIEEEKNKEECDSTIDEMRQ